MISIGIKMARFSKVLGWSSRGAELPVTLVIVVSFACAALFLYQLATGEDQRVGWLRRGMGSSLPESVFEAAYRLGF